MSNDMWDGYGFGDFFPGGRVLPSSVFLEFTTFWNCFLLTLITISEYQNLSVKLELHNIGF